MIHDHDHKIQTTTTTTSNTAMTRTGSLLLPISAAIALFGNLCMPSLAFHVEPYIIQSRQHCRSSPLSKTTKSTTCQLSADDEFQNSMSREQEIMEQAYLMEQQLQQSQMESSRLPSVDAPPIERRRIDPLIASLTRIDEPTPSNVPMVQVPLFGEVPADGTLALLIPAAAISILGFILSIVVAFNSRDSIVQGLSSVELPKMEYTPTIVEEGKCRGLCSSQDEDLDGLRNFMESISNK